MLPPLSGTSAQTPSQTVATQAIGRTLQVQINIEKNPIDLPSIQVITVTVLDPAGVPVYDALVHITVLPPAGRTQAFDGFTDASGHYSTSLYVAAITENVGTFQVVVSATKDGYEEGQAQTTFQAAVAPS